MKTWQSRKGWSCHCCYACVLTLRRIFPSSPPMSLRALTREIGKHNYSAAQSALLTGEAPSNMQIQTPWLDGDDENKIKSHALASGCRELLPMWHCLQCYFFPCVLSRLRKQPVPGISFENGRCEWFVQLYTGRLEDVKAIFLLLLLCNDSKWCVKLN
jgi:hypothetical protein